MKILIACDKFKGSLSALEVTEAVTEGLGSSFQISSCPIADGGEGFVEAMVTAMNGEFLACRAVDARHREIEARYGMFSSSSGEKIAVIEMAEADGLWRIAEADRDVSQSSTFGTGLIIANAITQGADRILIGIGGSATNDGGIGMAAALGWQFFDENGTLIEKVTPANAARISRYEAPESAETPPIEVACDVDNPLLGENGATAIYGPQKGVSEDESVRLENFLRHLSSLSPDDSLREIPGAGAAGGLGWGLMNFLGATLRPGFDIVADAVSLREKIATTDLVITGEGSLDAQSLSGKGPIGVAKLAREAGKRTAAVAGQISSEVKESGFFDHTISLAETGKPVPELIANARTYLVTQSAKLAQQLQPETEH